MFGSCEGLFAGGFAGERELGERKNVRAVRATHFSHSGIRKSFSEIALQTRESLKRPYFPLPLSILAGTNLIMLLLLFFLQPPFDSQENPSHTFDFRESSSSFEKIHAKRSWKTKKTAFLCFLLPVFSGSVLGVSLPLCHSLNPRFLSQAKKHNLSCKS